MKRNVSVYLLFFAIVLGFGFLHATPASRVSGLIPPVMVAQGGGTDGTYTLPSPDRGTLPGSDYRNKQGSDSSFDPMTKDQNPSQKQPSTLFCLTYKGLCPGS
jgi:hypothetical protein